MKHIYSLITLLSLATFLPAQTSAQSANTIYKNRTVTLAIEGNKVQQGFIIGERNKRLYIVTILTEAIDKYPDDIAAIINDSQQITGRWVKDDKASEAVGLVLLSIPKPANFRLNSITYYTRSVQGQLVSMQSFGISKPISLRIGTSLDGNLALNPASAFKPSSDLIGAPVYLPDKGLIGIVSSVKDIMLQAIRISLIRDAIREDENDLFDAVPLDKEADEVTVSKTENSNQDIPSNEVPIGNINPYPGGKNPTVSDIPDKVHRLRFGVGFGVNFIPKPSSPASTLNDENKVPGYASFTVDYSLFKRLVLHTGPRWTKYRFVLAKDPKYANYSLTNMYMENVMIPVGIDYHFSNNSTTFFLRAEGAISKILYGNYEYVFNGKADRVSLVNSQMVWQKAVVAGLGAKSKNFRLLIAYYYALDPFINDNELTKTVPQVTPFKQQQTFLRYTSIEFGFYF